MTVSQTFFTTLSTDGDVGPLVANAVSPQTYRIFPDLAPDNVAKPFIVYSQINERIPVSFNDVNAVAEYDFQIDIYADTHAEVITLKDHIIDAVNTGMKLTQAFNPGSSYENDTELYRYMLQLTVWE